MNKSFENIEQKFSFFKNPITNIQPYKEINLVDVYQVINGSYYKKITKQLRAITDKKENRNFKAKYFPYCTFSGTFTNRNENSLIKHSGYLALDFDKLDDIFEIKRLLLKDIYFETELLYISPNGNGLKWIITIDINGKYSHSEYFQAIYNYIKRTYSIEVDKSCRDISRASFICYDPTAWINPKYLIK